MSNINRWFPRLTLVVVAGHLATAVALHRRTYREMVSEGLVGTADGRHEREAATWFLVAAPALAGLGLASREAVAETGRIPVAVPFTMLGLGALITTLSPLSGGWALLGLGAAGLVERRRSPARSFGG